MSKTRNQSKSSALVKRTTIAQSAADFDEVMRLIEAARSRAVATVNKELIDLYWNIGKHISSKIGAAGWGKGTVQALADYIRQRHPGMNGFSAQNLWRMRQFYDVYARQPKLSPLVRELTWSHNLLIMGKCKRPEEREFYLRFCRREHWGKRELERQLAGALFERTILSPPKLSSLVTELHPQAINVFKDAYLLKFLDLPAAHSEADLHDGLVDQLQRFLIELGRDFCFVGSKYRLQVGGRDFELDLLLFNRALNCLVAIELKIDEFQPEHLGKLEFYLEALDRDIRKPHENPKRRFRQPGESTCRFEPVAPWSCRWWLFHSWQYRAQ